MSQSQCNICGFTNWQVRNDGRDSGIEEGAMTKPNHDQNDSVVGLDAVEFQVFKNALKCAAYPVLGAPQPPSSGTPIPHTAGEKLRGAVEKSLCVYCIRSNRFIIYL